MWGAFPLCWGILGCGLWGRLLGNLLEKWDPEVEVPGPCGLLSTHGLSGAHSSGALCTDQMAPGFLGVQEAGLPHGPGLAMTAFLSGSLNKKGTVCPW